MTATLRCPASYGLEFERGWGSRAPAGQEDDLGGRSATEARPVVFARSTVATLPVRGRLMSNRGLYVRPWLARIVLVFGGERTIRPSSSVATSCIGECTQREGAWVVGGNEWTRHPSSDSSSMLRRITLRSRATAAHGRRPKLTSDAQDGGNGARHTPSCAWRCSVVVRVSEVVA